MIHPRFTRVTKDTPPGRAKRTPKLNMQVRPPELVRTPDSTTTTASPLSSPHTNPCPSLRAETPRSPRMISAVASVAAPCSTVVHTPRLHRGTLNTRRENRKYHPRSSYRMAESRTMCMETAHFRDRRHIYCRQTCPRRPQGSGAQVKGRSPASYQVAVHRLSCAVLRPSTARQLVAHSFVQ